MGIKIKKLFLNNFEKFANFSVEFGNSITRLIGLNGSGKTTIGCTAIWAGLRGIAEKATNGQLIGSRYHFIGDGKASADIQIELQDDVTGEVITCKNHITKDTNKITFTSSTGRQLTNEWMDKLFSVVFMSAKNFCSLSGKDQAIQLGIDTTDIDNKIKQAKAEYTIINREYKAFGEISPVNPVSFINIDALKKEKLSTEADIAEQIENNKKTNQLLRENYELARKKEVEEMGKFNLDQSLLSDKRDKVSYLIREIKSYGYFGQELDTWFSSMPVPQPFKTGSSIVVPEYLHETIASEKLTYISKEIEEAYENNILAEKYAKFRELLALKEGKKKELDINIEKQSQLAEQKKALVSSHKFNIEGVKVDDEGALILNGRPIRDPYFSKGELEVIVADLASSINTEWKTRFVDDFDLLDEINQEKLIKTLTGKGYQVIVAEVGQKAVMDGSIVLRECKVGEILPEETF